MTEATYSMGQFAMIGLILGLFAIIGFRRGVGRELLSFAGVCLGLLVASMLTPALVPLANRGYRLLRLAARGVLSTDDPLPLWQQVKAEQPLITTGGEAGRNHDLHRPLGLRFLQFCDDGAGKSSQVHRTRMQLASRYPRKSHQIVDQPAHVLAGLANPPEKFLAPRIQISCVKFEEHFTKTANAPQRGSQVV